MNLEAKTTQIMNIKIQMIPLLPLNVKNWSPQHGIQHPNLSRVKRQTLMSTAALTSWLRALMLPMKVVRYLSAYYSATTVTGPTKTKLTNWIAGK